MNYYPVTICSHCSYVNWRKNQPVGDGCHNCSMGYMMEYK